MRGEGKESKNLVHLQNEAGNIRRMIKATRRGMMGLAAAALFQTLSISIPSAQAQAPVTLSPDMQQLSDIMAGKIGQSPAEAGKPVVTIIEAPPHDQDDRVYRFLGSNQFLAAAAKANVLTVGNEISVLARPIFMKLEAVAAAHDENGIASIRSDILNKLKPAQQGAVGVSSQETDATSAHMLDYVENAAQANIEVSPRDTAATDPKLAGLFAKLGIDNGENDHILAESNATNDPALKAGYLKRQTELQKDADRLTTEIAAERASEEGNTQIVAALEADQKRFGGNLVVPYGVIHGDAMEKLFRRDGYAVARIALHASADGMKADQDYAAQYHVAYRGIPFLMDSMTFASKNPPMPQAIHILQPLRQSLQQNDVTLMRSVYHDSEYRMYGFLAKDSFLDTAKAADIRTIANELPREFQGGIDALQTAIWRKDTPEAVANAKQALLADLTDRFEINTANPEASKAEYQGIADYVEGAARRNIRIVADDNASTDDHLTDLVRREIDDRQKLAAIPAGQPVSRALVCDFLGLDHEVVQNRMSPAANKPLTDPLVAEQKTRGGKLLVVYGPLHTDIMRQQFEQAGLKTGTIALHVSQAALQNDADAYGQFGATFSHDQNFSMESGTFVSAGNIKPHAGPPRPACPN